MNVEAAALFFRPAALRDETQPRVGDGAEALAARDTAARFLVGARLTALASAACATVLSLPGESTPVVIAKEVAFVLTIGTGIASVVCYGSAAREAGAAHELEETGGVNCEDIAQPLTLRDLE